MKILATSDIHGFLDGLLPEIEKEKPDLFVIAGDIEPCMRGIDVNRWFACNFRAFLEQAHRFATRIVIVPGNHDFWLSEAVAPYHEFHNHYIDVLKDSSSWMNGKTIYGTPWSPYINGRWVYEASEPTLAMQYTKIPQRCDILISHTPPLIRHHKIDISNDHPESMQRHFGSKALMDVIRDKQPKVVICGHIHSGDHSAIKIEGTDAVTRCFNVSRVNENYEVAYPCTVIEI